MNLKWSSFNIGGIFVDNKGGVFMYTCKICGEVLETYNRHLRKHLRKVHNMEKWDYALKYEPDWPEKGIVQKPRKEGELTKKEKQQLERENNPNNVRCEICGKKFKFLPIHLVSAHGMTSEEYKKKFPGKPLISEEYLENKKSAMKALYTEEKRKQISEIMKKKWQDEEYRKKMKQIASKVITEYNKKAWQDPEYRKRKSELQKQVVARQLQDPEFRKMLSENGKKSWKNASEEFKNRRRNQARELALKNNERWKYDEEYRARMSERTAELVRKGIFTYKPSTKILIDGEKEYVMKSAWEVAVYIWLKDKNYTFEYEPIKVPYNDKNGNPRVYIPDFFVHELDSYLEVKGWVRDKEKLQLQIEAVKLQTGKDVILVDQSFIDTEGITPIINKVRGKKVIIL